jgi:cytochrome oxidase Cu insertion factor (SCO1/SenC/PrrC family)
MRSILLLPLLMVTATAADPLKPRDGSLKVGDAAPAFELKQLGTDKSIKLADLKDKPVVLVFGSCT